MEGRSQGVRSVKCWCQSVNACLEKKQGGNKTFSDKNWELLQAVDPYKGRTSGIYLVRKKMILESMYEWNETNRN